MTWIRPLISARKERTMSEQFTRTQILYGEDAMKRLAACRVAVFGIGGVGGYVVEALARSGIGALDLIDNDKVCVSNINRQIIATWKTVGRDKVDVAAERVAEINPDCTVRTYKTFLLPENAASFDFASYDYVVDAIDTVAGKLALAEAAREAGTPIICSMGAGNKLDPAAFRVADIAETSVCPLAKVMRKECKKRGIDSLKVVYSKEEPRTPLAAADGDIAAEDGPDAPAEKTSDASAAEFRSARRRATPGSTAFAPSVVGLIIAGEVINDLTGQK